MRGTVIFFQEEVVVDDKQLAKLIRKNVAKVEKAAKATLVGDVFDDAATGQGLLNYFLRAINCGAITVAEAIELSGLTLPELHSASFVKILKNRQEL